VCNARERRKVIIHSNIDDFEVAVVKSTQHGHCGTSLRCHEVTGGKSVKSISSINGEYVTECATSVPKLWTIWAVTELGYGEIPSAVTPWSPANMTTREASTFGSRVSFNTHNWTARSSRRPREPVGFVLVFIAAQALCIHPSIMMD
jgi:hypothetical protein